MIVLSALQGQIATLYPADLWLALLTTLCSTSAPSVATTTIPSPPMSWRTLCRTTTPKLGYHFERTQWVDQPKIPLRSTWKMRLSRSLPLNDIAVNVYSPSPKSPGVTIFQGPPRKLRLRPSDCQVLFQNEESGWASGKAPRRFEAQLIAWSCKRLPRVPSSSR